MKALNILGLTIFFAGSLTIAGFGLYEFFKDSTIPILVRMGIVSIILGIIIILISLTNERLKEKN
jgi:tetrahydromethanopterin S-methyltransferase subunit E